MLNIYFNLIAFNFKLNVLRFAHTSFQDYLETKAKFAQYDAYKVTATSCLNLCLKGLSLDINFNIFFKDSFYLYSAVY